MSTFQIDGATKDEELRRVCDAGSDAFLSGTIRVQEGMRLLDLHNLEEASDIGLKAVDDFSAAVNKFQAGGHLIRERSELTEELGEHLRRVGYRETAVRLGVREPEKAVSWVYVQGVAINEGAGGLFAMAVDSAKGLGEAAGLFFKKVQTKEHTEQEGATLLFHVGMSLIIGIYVSAIFRRE